MITLIKKGVYKLIETYSGTKMLILDDRDTFAWIHVKNIGGLLILASLPKRIMNSISAGAYRIYDVFDEPDVTDLEHLELQTSDKQWQGYLLLSGLPEEEHLRSRIIPTGELIHTSIAQRFSPWQNHLKAASESVQLANNPTLVAHRIIGRGVA